MKISYNWIQEYLDFPLPPVGDLVTAIGAQLGEVEAVVDLGAKYQNVIIVDVVKCQPVVDSDHLSVCLINDGGKVPNLQRDEQGLVQVVCGAPNVRAGITVAWLPPGATVPSSFDKDPFVLGSRTLRGVVSNGMLASAQELAIGDNHDGILELEAVAAGCSFAEVYGLNDTIIDIENKMFTHRPDCFGILGVAREISGILGHAFVEPDWYKTESAVEPGLDQLPLVIRNETPAFVPRLMAATIANLTIQPSPVRLQTYLSRIGIRPINNIVDATNYYMYLTGQPLHAYDYDKLRALDGTDTATLVARQPMASETLQLLNGKTIEPHGQAVIMATNDHAVGLGGAMGGAATEVDQNTRNIILECATFEMYSTRKTSMIHGLFSEAVTRFTKGQSPLQNGRILAAAGNYITALTGGAFASALLDAPAPNLDLHQSIVPDVTISLKFIADRLGLEIPAETIITLLSHVGFSVSENEAELLIAVPFWRTDIAIAEDIVEEVGRLYGFDNLPTELPLRSMLPAAANPRLALKTALRNALQRAGANEVLTYSFVHGKLLDRVGQNKQLAYRLTNALSPDLQYYRLSLTPSLLDKVQPNLRAGYDQFAIYEIGKAHLFSETVSSEIPVEYDRLALVFAADVKAAAAYDGAAFFVAKVYLSALIQQLGLAADLRFEAATENSSTDAVVVARSAVYEPARMATVMVGDILVGEIGEYRADIRKALKLPAYCAGFEVDLAVLEQLQRSETTYQRLTKFPKLAQDICLRVPADTSYASVMKVVHETVTDFSGTIEIVPIDVYQSASELEHKQITVRLIFTSDQKTLTDTEISNVLDQITARAVNDLAAVRV